MNFLEIENTGLETLEGLETAFRFPSIDVDDPETPTESLQKLFMWIQLTSNPKLRDISALAAVFTFFCNPEAKIRSPRPANSPRGRGFRGRGCPQSPNSPSLPPGVPIL